MKLKRKPKIRPMAGKVVINPEPLDTITQGGIILSAKANPTNIRKGVVVALGNPVYGIPVQMKYKDVVVFFNKSGVKYESENHEYLILNQNEIIATI